VAARASRPRPLPSRSHATASRNGVSKNDETVSIGLTVVESLYNVKNLFYATFCRCHRPFPNLLVGRGQIARPSGFPLQLRKLDDRMFRHKSTTPDFNHLEAIKRQDYKSAGPALRAEWSYWRNVCPKYGFGRHELLPVKTTAEGIARYVGGYVAKHIDQRELEDKGARIVRFIGFKPGHRHFYSNCSLLTVGSWAWRQKLGAWCKRQDIETLWQLKEIFGVRWAHLLQDEILNEPVETSNPVTPQQASALRPLVPGRPLRDFRNVRIYQIGDTQIFMQRRKL